MNENQFAEKVKSNLNKKVPFEVIIVCVQAIALTLATDSDQVTEFLQFAKGQHRAKLAKDEAARLEAEQKAEAKPVKAKRAKKAT